MEEQLLILIIKNVMKGRVPDLIQIGILPTIYVEELRRGEQELPSAYSRAEI
jgi:hypothetical protein